MAVRWSRALKFSMKKYGYRPAGQEVSVQRVTGTDHCSGWWYIHFGHWYAMSLSETVTLKSKAEVRKWIKKHCLPHSEQLRAMM